MEETPEIFSCTLCGKCCQGYGGTYVTQEDILAISSQIGANPETFVATYCQMAGKRPVLAQGENGCCVFWNKVCTIHEVKPRMCRQWPFIKGVLADPANWDAMATACPGMRTGLPHEIILAATREKLGIS